MATQRCIRLVTLAMMAPALAACPSTEQAETDPGSNADSRAVWFVNDPGSTETIDHSPWEEFLQKYHRELPDGVNRIDYDAVSDDDHIALKQYLSYLGTIQIETYSRDEQIAFWMDLYNAAIVDLVLDSMPVNSVLQIRGPGINVVGPWLRPVAQVHGQFVSFNDIEHYILRAAFNDMGPPIHYGVNCASMGCPSLAPHAHTAQNWRQNLERIAHQFINGPEGVRFEDGQMYTSKVYHSWFKEDFGGNDKSVIEHLLKYAEPELAAELKKHSAIAGDYYDWRLNKPDGS
ncbi:MAG TPA: DUF547 domain-containing protein [Alphaproteobacteria bacterium]